MLGNDLYCRSIASGFGFEVVFGLTRSEVGVVDTFHRSNMDFLAVEGVVTEVVGVEEEEGVPGKDLGFLAEGSATSLSPAASDLLRFFFFESSGGDLILMY